VRQRRAEKGFSFTGRDSSAGRDSRADQSAGEGSDGERYVSSSSEGEEIGIYSGARAVRLERKEQNTLIRRDCEGKAFLQVKQKCHCRGCNQVREEEEKVKGRKSSRIAAMQRLQQSALRLLKMKKMM